MAFSPYLCRKRPTWQGSAPRTRARCDPCQRSRQTDRPHQPSPPPASALPMPLSRQTETLMPDKPIVTGKPPDCSRQSVRQTDRQTDSKTNMQLVAHGGLAPLPRHRRANCAAATHPFLCLSVRRLQPRRRGIRLRLRGLRLVRLPLGLILQRGS
jgi:hypothetical protein